MFAARLLQCPQRAQAIPRFLRPFSWSARSTAAVNRASARRVSESDDWPRMGRPRVMRVPAEVVARGERVPIDEEAGKVITKEYAEKCRSGPPL